MKQLSSIDQFADSLIEAFGSNRVREYFDHFSPDATFIFYSNESILYSRQEYINLWDEWVRDGNFAVVSCIAENRRVQMIGDSTAILFHEVTTVVRVDGVQEKLRERESIIFHKESNGWRAVHEHLSEAKPISVEATEIG